MLAVNGKARVSVGSKVLSGNNLVLNGGVERFLAGERVWDMLKTCELGGGDRTTKPQHKGLQDPLCKTVPVTLEEYFDEALGCAIIKVRAEFAGPLSGVKEFAWGDSAGVWSRLTLDKLEGHLGSIDIDGDETLTVELDVAVAMVQSAFPVVVNFDGAEIGATVVPVGVDNPLAWSAQGLGANKGIGYWGSAVGLAGSEKEAPMVAQVVGELVPYAQGDFNRTLKINLSPDEGNIEGGLHEIYFGTAFEGTRNIHWLWKLVFDEPFIKSPQVKLWLELSWAVLRG